MTPSPALVPTHPLQKVINDLQKIIHRQTANPSDPALKELLIDVQVELSQAIKSIVGVADDTNRGG